MRFLLLTVLTVLQVTIVWSQDKELEAKFFSDRSKLRSARIEEITKRVSQYWKNQCVKDSSEIRFKFKFNRRGDLVRTDKFSGGRYWTTTKYVRNKKGDYVQKSYTYYDSLEKIKSVDNWTFGFNPQGRRVSEIWTRGRDTVRINKLTYDDNGNVMQQLTDLGWVWRFEYDDKRKLIKSDECVVWSDSLRCQSTKYQYEAGILKRKLVYGVGSVQALVFEYFYDSSKQLAAVKHHRSTIHEDGSGQKTEVITTYVTKYEYDSHGNCTTESEFSGDETSPFRCTYYDYKYY